MNTDQLNITYVPVGKLKPAPYNPRKIDSDEMERLKLSLKTYGIVDPVIVQKSSGLVIGGHQRLTAAKALGWATVPVVYLDIDDTKAKALNLALNRISGEWDFPKLKDLMVEIDTGGINMEITGFPLDEIEQIFAYDPSPKKEEPEREQSGNAQDKTAICPRCKHEFEI